MIISLKQFKLPIVIILILSIISISILMMLRNKAVHPVMGGFVHANDKYKLEQVQPTFSTDIASNDSERFQRPSKQPALKLKYAAKDFIDMLARQPDIQTTFQNSIDVIQAYFAILLEAENMDGYHGGCGTVGWSIIPYPYAYQLLSKETRQKMSLEKFKVSFAGIGHTTLLKLYSAYRPPKTAQNIKYNMVEIEVITGPPITKENENKPQPSYFAYYYGLVTTEYTPSEGWKIKSIEYIPEDFLCHPMHHWDYDAKFLVGIVYKNWYGLIDEIEKIEKHDSLVRVYAVGSRGKYRFDFIRLTNGDDVLLHEYIQQNGQWKEVNLLKEEHQVYKFSVLNPNLINLEE